MEPEIEHIQNIVRELLEWGVPRALLLELLGKLSTTINLHNGTLEEVALGHIYELLKWRELKNDNAYKSLYGDPIDPRNVADLYSLMSKDVLEITAEGHRQKSLPLFRVAIQAKWSTSNAARAAYKNATFAIEQLSGAQGETPPPGTVLIADAVLANLPSEKRRAPIDLKQQFEQSIATNFMQNLPPLLFVHITYPPGAEVDEVETIIFRYDNGTSSGPPRYVKNNRSDIKGTPVIFRMLRAAVARNAAQAKTQLSSLL
ncbi:MAG: hypothetical protein QM784_38015 [Polyangiaceae bacterium]